MVKAITTIYLQSEVLEEAKAKGLNISLLCEEALKAVLNKENSLGISLEKQAEEGRKKALFEKNLNVLRILYVNPQKHKTFVKYAQMFCKSYNMPFEELVKLIR